MNCHSDHLVEINYKADFDLIISLLDIKGRLMPFPDYDFTIRLTSQGQLPAFVASQRSGVLHNCSDDQGRIHIYADNHGLRPGPLTLEFTAYIPDANFADGTRRLPVVEQLDVHLVPGHGQLPADIATSLGLPAIKVYPEEWMEQVKDTAELAASALQALYAYSVVDGEIAPYEFVTVTDGDGYGTVDYEASMELIMGLLNRDFPDAADGELVYDSLVQTMWVRYALAPGGWEAYGLPEGYYLDMRNVLCMRPGFADAPQPCIVRYAWNGSRDVFSPVSAPEPMTADSDADYTDMVDTLLTNYKIS